MKVARTVLWGVLAERLISISSGYMIFSCGLSNYSIGFFHLTNHAFLCAVLLHIFLHKTAFAVVKRSAHIVIRWLFKVKVERNWTVKTKVIGFIWGWLAKSDNMIIIRVKNAYNVKELCLKLLENQRLTTQELLWIYIINNCDICRWRPYFCCSLGLFCTKNINRVSVCNSRRKYYNQGVFYKFRCDNLNNKQIKFSSRRYFCLDLGSLRNEIQVLSKDVHPKILKSLDANKNPVRENCESIQKLVRLQQKLLSLSATKYGIYDIKTTSLANNYLCSLVFRIHAVSELLKNPGSKIPGMDGITLKRQNIVNG